MLLLLVGTKEKGVRRGVKEVVKALKKGQKGYWKCCIVLCCVCCDCIVSLVVYIVCIACIVCILCCLHCHVCIVHVVYVCTVGGV